MLQIVIPANDVWDERTQEFKSLSKSTRLQLEHSLISISKWESEWCKPFLSKTDKSHEELRAYIRCMVLTPNVSPEIFDFLSDENFEQIKNYINAPMTATKFGAKQRGGNNRETITSELIYYWMIALNIPFECQKWHLNRLLTLIEVCNRKNTPPKKQNQNSIMSRNSALNAARRAELNSRG